MHALLLKPPWWIDLCFLCLAPQVIDALLSERSRLRRPSAAGAPRQVAAGLRGEALRSVTARHAGRVRIGRLVRSSKALLPALQARQDSAASEADTGEADSQHNRLPQGGSGSMPQATSSQSPPAANVECGADQRPCNRPAQLDSVSQAVRPSSMQASADADAPAAQQQGVTAGVPKFDVGDASADACDPGQVQHTHAQGTGSSASDCGGVLLEAEIGNSLCALAADSHETGGRLDAADSQQQPEWSWAQHEYVWGAERSLSEDRSADGARANTGGFQLTGCTVRHLKVIVTCLL